MKYHNITHDDMRNGDGMRVVLWVSGCDHHCKNCQNPITWDYTDGIEFSQAEINELDTELSKEYISGITLSGGDPLHPKNKEDILNLVKYVKNNFPNKTIWVYTGYVWEDIIKDKIMYEIASLVDVIVDGEFVESLKDNKYHWAGSTNQRVIDAKKSCEEGRIVFHEGN